VEQEARMTEDVGGPQRWEFARTSAIGAVIAAIVSLVQSGISLISGLSKTSNSLILYLDAVETIFMAVVFAAIGAAAGALVCLAHNRAVEGRLNSPKLAIRTFAVFWVFGAFRAGMQFGFESVFTMIWRGIAAGSVAGVIVALVCWSQNYTVARQLSRGDSAA
jgi:hypothetical protein